MVDMLFYDAYNKLCKKKKKYMKSSHQGQLLKSEKYIEKVHIKW